MNDRAPFELPRTGDVCGLSFNDVPHNAREHFALTFYLGVLALLEVIGRRGQGEAQTQFAFLGDYVEELAVRGLSGCDLHTAARRWAAALSDWETNADRHLPLAALRRRFALEAADLAALMAVGLVDEDPRFGAALEAMQSEGRRRPAPVIFAGVIAGCAEGPDIRERLGRLAALGLVESTPLSELYVPVVLWNALRAGRLDESAGPFHHRPVATLPALDELVLERTTRSEASEAATLLRAHALDAVLVRGPRDNGRRALASALARASGRGIIEIEIDSTSAAVGRSLLGPLAVALDAMPLVVVDGAPGASVELDWLRKESLPVAIVLGRQGGIRHSGVERSATIEVPIPGLDVRRLLWRRAVPQASEVDIDAVAVQLRMTSGNVLRTAMQACAGGAVDGTRVQGAARWLARHDLEVLAQRVDYAADWSRLAASANILRELRGLEARCRHRERLGAALGHAFTGSLGAGVRALFRGPSGTGKTLAAAALARSLQKDLYRVDLGAVVDKYIGETEKNLERLFARAEELDVVLLLDEGDALLGRRTSVHSANDRYANLETNFLLQRLETSEAIVIVTTNAGERIDDAFLRRMDVVIDFALPEAADRLAIWRMHLPERHAVPADAVKELAARCALSGAQIRNAVLYAALMATEALSQIDWSRLEEAVRREYRKANLVCPLRGRAGRMH